MELEGYEPIEALGESVRIITTEECLAATKDPARYPTRFLGAVPVRGKADSVRAYELLDGG